MDRLKAKATLAIVMLVTLLGSAGIALPYPVLAPYFISDSTDPLIHFMNWDGKVLLGITLATYPLGLFIGSNVIISIRGSFIALISADMIMWTAALLIIGSIMLFKIPERPQTSTEAKI